MFTQEQIVRKIGSVCKHLEQFTEPVCSSIVISQKVACKCDSEQEKIIKPQLLLSFITVSLSLYK